MACIGDDCFIVKQEARKSVLRQVKLGDQCTPEQVTALQNQAESKIITEATQTRETCPSGCKCEPVKGGTTTETEWSEVQVAPFTLTDGDCRFEVLAATVETRIVKTPGLCKEERITVASAAFIADDVEIRVRDVSRLSIENIRKVHEIFG